MSVNGINIFGQKQGIPFGRWALVRARAMLYRVAIRGVFAPEMPDFPRASEITEPRGIGAGRPVARGPPGQRCWRSRSAPVRPDHPLHLLRDGDPVAAARREGVERVQERRGAGGGSCPRSASRRASDRSLPPVGRHPHRRPQRGRPRRRPARRLPSSRSADGWAPRPAARVGRQRLSTRRRRSTGSSSSRRARRCRTR